MFTRIGSTISLAISATLCVVKTGPGVNISIECPLHGDLKCVTIRAMVHWETYMSCNRLFLLDREPNQGYVPNGTLFPSALFLTRARRNMVPFGIQSFNSDSLSQQQLDYSTCTCCGLDRTLTPVWKHKWPSPVYIPLWPLTCPTWIDLHVKWFMFFGRMRKWSP